MPNLGPSETSSTAQAHLHELFDHFTFHYLVIAGDTHGVAPVIGSVVSLLLLPRLANVARGIAQLSSLISMLRAVMAQMPACLQSCVF